MGIHLDIASGVDDIPPQWIITLMDIHDHYLFQIKINLCFYCIQNK